jgi:hypothetical protein
VSTYGNVEDIRGSGGETLWKVDPGCVVCIATGYGWTVRGSNPGGGDIFRTCPDRSWGPPSLLYNGYRVFLGDKAVGAWR